MKALKTTLLTIATLVALGFIGVLGINTLIGAANEPVRPHSVELSKYEVGPPTAEELLELVNAERERVGVKPLSLDKNVQKSAQLKADDMADRDYFSHIVKGTKYTLTPEMDKWISKSCSESSENIQFTEEGTSQTAFDRWVDSKPHHRAMIDPKYTSTGFGVSFDTSIKESEIDGSIRRDGHKGDTKNAFISVEHFCIAK